MNLLLACATLGYLLGSFPAGYIAGRIAGVDIRTVGSGNVGATNVVRILGKRVGYPVFFVDFAKGLVSVVSARALANGIALETTRVEIAMTLAGLSAILGHSFPVWLKFRGGKGVATSVGVLFGLVPLAATVVCAVWLVTFQIGRYVSLASIVAVSALPVCVGAMFLLHRLDSPVFFYLSLVMALLVLIRHRANLIRLANGTEPRFERK